MLTYNQLQLTKFNIEPLPFSYVLYSGHSIPNQQKKIRTPFDFHEIWHKHGPYQETFSHQNLAHFIGLPLSYDHSKFLLKMSFYLHVFNKMTITLLVIDVDTSGLDF